MSLLLNIGMNKDRNAIGLQPGHDSPSHLGRHQSFHKSVEVENIVKAVLR